MGWQCYQVLDHPFGAVLDTDTRKVPHEIIGTTLRAMVFLDYLIAPIAELFCHFQGKFIKPFPQIVADFHVWSFRFRSSE
jgi:hypothetical protein